MDQLTSKLKEYNELLSSQTFVKEDLDYTLFEKQIPFLDQMANVKNSGITVFDLFQQKHIYSSYNLEDIFGYDMKKVKELGNSYFNSRIHPDDFVHLTVNGVMLMKFILSLPVDERKNYKLQNEYRILNHRNNYIRIIEQHSLFELDAHGNIWLSLSILDISPNQDVLGGIVSQLIHIKTGQLCDFNLSPRMGNLDGTVLSKRETEILQLVKEGFLSKEISSSLSLSVHTINTHRQNILKKLGANNSLEAVEFATRLGFV